MSRSLPRSVVVVPAARPLQGTVRSQPSKNYAARWLWTSALCAGKTTLDRLPDSEDAAAMIACCAALGATIERGEGTEAGATVTGFGTRPRRSATLNPHNAGAVLRFTLGAAALGGAFRFITDRDDSLGRRPNLHLVEALERWGVTVQSSGDEGQLPIVTRAEVNAGTADDIDTTWVRGGISSQYLSSLLMVAPVRAALRGVAQTIHVEGELRSRPAVETTLDVMTARGVAVEREEGIGRYDIPPAAYAAGSYRVNGDWPGAAAVLCAAAVVPGSQVRISELQEDAQGERRILDTLAAAGCAVQHEGGGVVLEAPATLRAFTCDGNLATDAVPPLLAVAALAQGTSTITGVGTLRYKESDRIEAPLAELARLGVRAKADSDAFTVVGRPEGFDGGVTLHGHSDHRLIMMGVALGLRARRPITVDTVPHLAKSYPRFLDDLARLGVEFRF